MLIKRLFMTERGERMSQETISLELSIRETVGKGLGKLRREGRVPGVIHDHGKPSIVVDGPYQEVYKTFLKAGKHHPVQINTGGKTYTALIKDASFEPRKSTITHIVFNAVNANQTVTAEVPVHVKFAEGDEQTPAEQAGLIVLHNTETVEIEAVPKDLPDVLNYPAEKLVEVGDQITVADLIVPKNVTVKADETTVLATVFEPSALAAANDAAGGDAEPGDEAEVEAEHESNTEAGTQEAEIRPGGKREFEDKEQGHNPTKQ
jgi:large subunit ribosomal protein L25